MVAGLGMMLAAGRHQQSSVPPAEEIEVAETAIPGEPPAQMEPVAPQQTTADTEAPQIEMAAASQVPPGTESPFEASPPSSPEPSVKIPIAPPQSAQGKLLPSAQNWMEQNAPPVAVAPAPPAPKAKLAAAPAGATATAALGKANSEAVPKKEPAGNVPKSQPNKADVAPFKTAVVKAPQETLYAPVLLELKNAGSLMQVFEDLQRRHSALAGKRAELRPAAGPNNESWFALLAVPAVPKTEAEAICRAMGAEGATLRCRTTKY